jgi:HlyD family secretion protein
LENSLEKMGAMSIVRFILIFLAIAAAFAGGWLMRAQNPDLRTAEASVVPEDLEPLRRVIAQGRILPASGIYNVVAAPGQRIESVFVTENDLVHADKTQLVTLDGEKTLELQTELVDAKAEEAATELDQKILAAENNLTAAINAIQSAGLRLTEASSELDLSVAEKRIKSATEKINRLVSLKSDPDAGKYVSQGEIADQQLILEEARSQIDTGKRQQASAIKAAKLGVELAEKTRGSAQRVVESLTKLRGEERSAKLSKQIAVDRRDAARIVAPIDGTVLKLFAKPGDVVGSKPLMQIGDLSEMECVAEVVDRMVGEVKNGQAVTINSPALAQSITGKVVSIGRFVGRSTMPDPSPLALVDRKTVEVRIRINAKDNETASRLVNLQVTVEISTHRD